VIELDMVKKDRNPNPDDVLKVMLNTPPQPRIAKKKTKKKKS